MCEEAGCERLLQVGDPCEGRCVGEVEVCEPHGGFFWGRGDIGKVEREIEAAKVVV